MVVVVHKRMRGKWVPESMGLALWICGMGSCEIG